MNFWIDAPYDERLLRRTLRHLIRRTVLIYRALGLMLVLLGALLASSAGTRGLGVIYLVGGVVVIAVVGPLLVRYAIRCQSPALRVAMRMTFTDQYFTASGPLFETRYQWPLFASVTDTTEAWLLMVGKLQAIAVPKSAMTPDQQQTFAAFLAARRPGGHPAALARPE